MINNIVNINNSNSLSYMKALRVRVQIRLAFPACRVSNDMMFLLTTFSSPLTISGEAYIGDTCIMIFTIKL
jgi:hypothetical protein